MDSLRACPLALISNNQTMKSHCWRPEGKNELLAPHKLSLCMQCFYATIQAPHFMCGNSTTLIKEYATYTNKTIRHADYV